MPEKKWLSLLLPIALFATLIVLIKEHPGAVDWHEYPSFRLLPYILACLTVILGCLFTQSKVSFLSMLLAVITFFINYYYFSGNNITIKECGTMILLASIYVPAITAIFYHLKERGIFTMYGFINAAILVSALMVILLLPGIESITEKIARSKSIMIAPVSDLIAIPGIGLVFFAAAMPPLLVRNRNESPLLGPFMALSMLFVFGAINFRSSLWETQQEFAVFSVFMSGACATLALAVMESSWRHAHIDELTDLPGRRALKHHMAKLTGSNCIAVMDIDHFKKINDRHGHDTGDQVLRFIASFLKNNDAGKAYRYGGEEFVIVCYTDDIKQAKIELNELRQNIHDRKFILRGKDRPSKKPELPKTSKTPNQTITVSVSIGVACCNKRHPTPQETFEAADKAVYNAKKAGRNCVKMSR